MSRPYIGDPLNKWVVDAYVRGDRVFLAVFDEDRGTVKEVEVNIPFYGYLACDNSEKLASELSGLDGVLEARVEEWSFPPYYTSRSKVVVFKASSYRALKRALSLSSKHGLKVLNTFPHPLVEALYRAGIRPLTRVWENEDRLVRTEPWNPVTRDPDLSYVVLGVENGFYVVKTPREKTLLRSVEEVVDYLRPEEFHVGFADPYVYARVIEVEPKVASRGRWVTGGFHSPGEYFEWSRLSYTPLSLMNNVTIGRILTTIEALLARDRKMVIDKQAGRRERWRSLRELLLYDRGGVVYQPKPGFYWWVCQIDFKSLYPSIIVKYNVSGETVNKPSCTGVLKLPWTPHEVCIDSEGMVPTSIKQLIDLKDLYDKLYKETGNSVYLDRKSAVKWILVASFGYLGYRNSLFGSVSAHEVVTSTSREVLRRARVAVESAGYRVIHAIVDSVFIDSVKTLEECECLKNTIEEATGFKAKVEAHFKWLYIPRGHLCEKGVANRYYGLLSNGSRKVKGVLAVRRDTPLLVKKAQQEALEMLFKAGSPGELASKITEAHNVIDRYVRVVERGDVDIYELVVFRESRVRGGYRRPPEYVLASRPPYRLLYTRAGLTPLEANVESVLDPGKYVRLLEKARRELPRLEDLVVPAT